MRGCGLPGFCFASAGFFATAGSKFYYDPERDTR